MSSTTGPQSSAHPTSDLMTYSPANDLYKAAVELLQTSELRYHPALKALKDAVARCDEAIADRGLYKDSIEYARDTHVYNTDEREIDDLPVTSAAEGDGVWVSGWLWCPWWTTQKIKPTQIVWTSESDIRLYCEPVDSEEFDEDDFVCQVNRFLDDRAEVGRTILYDSQGRYIGANITETKIAKLDVFGVPVIDGRD